MGQLAMEYGKDQNVSFVFLDQGLKKVTGINLRPNIRPDVTVIYKDGTVSMIEVASKTDTLENLKARIGAGRLSLPESMHGTIDAQRPVDIINRGRRSNQ